jgi:ankyrin repeat protein
MGFSAHCLLALALGAPPEKMDSPYQAALLAAVHHFARQGELDHLKAILKKHPQLVDAPEKFRQPRKPLTTDGFTPLMHAARHGQEEVVAYLVQRGANVNYADGAGWTALHVAAQAGHLGTVKQLVRHGADVDAKTEEVPEGIAPGSAPGARPQNFPAIPSLTPLELAVKAKHQEVAEYLRSKGK